MTIKKDTQYLRASGLKPFTERINEEEKVTCLVTH